MKFSNACLVKNCNSWATFRLLPHNHRLLVSMEHEEIDLYQKQNNKRGRHGRFGVSTNKTLKYDRSALQKKKDTIAIFEDGAQPGISFRDNDPDVGISLNARKNWEILDKNPLRTSQDGKVTNNHKLCFE